MVTEIRERDTTYLLAQTGYYYAKRLVTSRGPSQIYIPTMMLSVGYRWCPDALDPECTILSMVGRLAEGVTLRQAVAEFDTLRPGPRRRVVGFAVLFGHA